MVYANQDAYYNAIAASSSVADAAPFIDFMLEEIRNTLIKYKVEEVPNKLPNKVPNKSELSVLKHLLHKPSLTRAELSSATGLSDSGIKKS